MRRYFYGAHDDISWIDWSSDSKVLVVGSKDNSTKIYAVDLYKNFRPYLLGGHTDSIVGCFFEENSLDVNTVGKNGQLCIWQCSLALDELIPIDADTEPEPTVKKRKNNKESDDEEDNIDEDNVLEKTQAEIDKEFENAEFIEAENEVINISNKIFNFKININFI